MPKEVSAIRVTSTTMASARSLAGDPHFADSAILKFERKPAGPVKAVPADLRIPRSRALERCLGDTQGGSDGRGTHAIRARMRPSGFGGVRVLQQALSNG
jgi:hypothetical protein